MRQRIPGSHISSGLTDTAGSYVDNSTSGDQYSQLDCKRSNSDNSADFDCHECGRSNRNSAGGGHSDITSGPGIDPDTCASNGRACDRSAAYACPANRNAECRVHARRAEHG